MVNIDHGNNKDDFSNTMNKLNSKPIDEKCNDAILSNFNNNKDDFSNTMNQVNSKPMKYVIMPFYQIL